MPDSFTNSKIDKREQQISDIIDAAIELYAESGMDGLSMREIARKTGMSAKNIYNYFQSKREIFIGMRVKYLKSIENLILKIISNNTKNIIDFIIEIAEEFINWASENEEGFNILFLSEPPNSNLIGPIEDTYEPGKPLKIIRELIQKAYENGIICNIDPDSFTAYIWQYIYGIAYIERGITITQNYETIVPKDKFEKNPIYRKLDPSQYRKFAIQNLRLQIENYCEGEIRKKEIDKIIAFINKWINFHEDNTELKDYWLWIKELNDTEKIINFYKIIQENIRSIEKKLDSLIRDSLGTS
ncbi:MAG: TetR/AcrR family transcriptional regulator [Candidatus Lokiarchaeota archaeon]|nr:TetR/AcrR family transcriptional regulator [Candidatus Lokiarchaeota archaeon]